MDKKLRKCHQGEPHQGEPHQGEPHQGEPHQGDTIFRLGTCLASLFIGIFTFISLATPAVGIAHAITDSKCHPDCEEQQKVLGFRLTYQFLTILAHILSPVIRAAMVITVLEVKAI